MSEYRQLSPSETLQLFEEGAEWALWAAVFEAVDDIYGPGIVEKVEITSEGEWNDEDQTIYDVDFYSVYTADGEEDIPYNLTTGWWETTFAESKQWRSSLKNVTYQDFKAWGPEKVDDILDDEARSRLNKITRFSYHRDYGPDGTFIRSTPPEFPFSELYVKV